MESVSHTCRTCGKTPEQTKFRANGSGFYRADCNECEKVLQRVKRQEWRDRLAPVDDTPRVADGYAMMPYQGATIAWDTDGGMICLTDLWRAAGAPENNRPSDWLAFPKTQEYIEECRRQGVVAELDGNAYSRRGGVGGGGGVWREKIIALSYAQYLSAALYVACNKFLLEKWGQARQSGISDELLKAIAAHLGILPSMDAKLNGIARSIAGAERIEVKEYHRGRIYIGLLTDPLTIQSVLRELVEVPYGALIVFIGQTKPGEGQECLRIRDYSSKLLKMRPEYYQLLAVFDTDNPNDSEGLLLSNPPHGALRAIVQGRKRSQSFHVCTPEALEEYRKLARPYYAAMELQSSWAITSLGPAQSSLW